MAHNASEMPQGETPAAGAEPAAQDNMPAVADRMLALLAGNERWHGTHGEPTQRHDGNVVKLTIRGTAQTLPGPATPELWQRHLDGETPLGIAPIRADGTCHWGAIDVDLYDVDLAAIARWVAPRGFVCRSKSGGAHVYFFFAEEVPAARLVPWLRRIADDLAARIPAEPKKLEVFPKQATLAPDGKPSWLNMPYFDAARGRRWCADPRGAALGVGEFLDAAEAGRLPAAVLDEAPSGSDAGDAGPGDDGRASDRREPPGGRRRSPAEWERDVIRALETAPRLSYGDWVATGFALVRSYGRDNVRLRAAWIAHDERHGGEPGRAGAFWDDAKPREGDGGVALGTALHHLGLLRRHDQPPNGDPRRAPDPPPKRALHWLGERFEPTPWLVKDLVPARGAGLLVGMWGTGKTFVALDLAMSVIEGHAFAGRRVKQRGGTLFIAAEAGGELPLRLAAIAEHKLRLDAGRQGDLLRPRREAAFAWIDGCAPLLQGGPAELVDRAQEAAGTMRERFGTDLALVIVDTLAAAAGFENENDAAQAQRVMSVLHDLARATGATVVGLDHFGKDGARGTRGSSAKEASADFVLALLADRDEDGRVSDTRLAVRKLRAGGTGQETPFDLRVVDMGRDEDGDAVTSCVVEWGEPGSYAPPPKDKKTSEPWHKRVLQQAIDAVGGLPAQRDKVREAFWAACGDKRTPGARKTGFCQALKDLEIEEFEEDGVATLRPIQAPF